VIYVFLINIKQQVLPDELIQFD